MVDVEKIKKLRQETDLPIASCKKALEKAGDDMKKAGILLAEEQKRLAGKRKGRSTEEGIVTSYIHNNKKVGVLLDLRSETDFVARSDKFEELAHFLNLQIAAMNPRFVSEEMVPEELMQKNKNDWRQGYEKEGKPAHVVEDIIKGKTENYLKEVCLLSQPFVKDDTKSVKEMIDSYTAEFGENIRVERFARYEIS